MLCYWQGIVLYLLISPYIFFYLPVFRACKNFKTGETLTCFEGKGH